MTKTIYHIDLIDGTHRTGDLSLDTKGRFDQDVEVSSEDDGFDSPTSYIVSVIAEDEAGPTTSDAFTLQFRKHNPFAPKNSDD